MRFYAACILLAAWASCVLAATVDDWRSRSIYQVLTDRYGRTDASTTAKCDPAQGVYCGGTWQGIINNLDYIQNMGFTAVSIALNPAGELSYGLLLALGWWGLI